MNYWLMKSEPDAFGIDDLAKKPNATEPWNGVRNYQARNMLREQMKRGDLAFFYHSSCEVPGIVGIIEIVRAGYPDSTAFDPESKYYDPQTSSDKPRWFMVDVKLKRKFKHIISLQRLRNNPKLKTMQILRKGNRLSITPVTKEQWQAVLAME